VERRESGAAGRSAGSPRKNIDEMVLACLAGDRPKKVPDRDLTRAVRAGNVRELPRRRLVGSGCGWCVVVL